MSMEIEVAAAAKWWADQLVKAQPSLATQMGAEQESPMRTPLAVTTSLLLQATSQVDDLAAIERFRENLAIALLSSGHLNGYGFGVDYGPDAILADAATAAGIKVGMTTFPWKTVMWITPGSVRVSAGYAADVVDVPLGA
jgi:hypothetical protein